MLGSRELLNGLDRETLWKRYCGFLELDLESFQQIQDRLLMEQLRLIAPTPLGRHFLGGRPPSNVREFRERVPLTIYDDYTPFFSEGDGFLPEGVSFWAQTTHRGGTLKRIPYTQRAFQRLLHNLFSAFVLACATGKGDVRLSRGDRILFNLPPRPYLSGYVAFGIEEMGFFRGVLSPKESEKLEFSQRVEQDFQRALSTGFDILIALGSVLVKVGESFAHRSGRASARRYIKSPAALLRLARGMLYRTLARRGELLPRDLWRPKGIIAWGMDTGIYQERIQRYWGLRPFQFYACTEAGIMAMQSWGKEAMTFLPYSVFLEFVEEGEWLRSRLLPSHRPTTVLLHQLEPGKRYEVVITSFYGMPFMRYRIGHLIRVKGLRDRASGVQMPQIEFDARADELIDIGGFIRLDPQTVSLALQRVGLAVEDWVIYKQYIDGAPCIRLLLELKAGPDGERELEERLHEAIKALDPFYHDLDTMLGLRPLRVTLLPSGTFRRFYEKTGVPAYNGKGLVNTEDLERLLEVSRWAGAWG